MDLDFLRNLTSLRNRNREDPRSYRKAKNSPSPAYINPTVSGLTFVIKP